MPIKNSTLVKSKVIQTGLRALSNAPDENIIKFTYIFEKFMPKDYRGYIEFIRARYQEKHPALKLTKRILNDIDKNCRKKFIENMILAGLIDNQKIRDQREKTGQAAPYTILISPSMRCNLSCEGCYAKNYKKQDDLSFEVFDRVISQAKEMGVAFFTILGGEPFIRPDLFDIVKKHSDAYFQVYTNGTLLNETLVKKIKEAGNIMPNFQ